MGSGKPKECIGVIRFMSKAAASFIMTESVAKDVFAALGEDYRVPGIWIVDRLPDLIERSQQAMAASKEREAKAERAIEDLMDAAQGDSLTQQKLASQIGVGLSRRLVPVLEMMKRAQEQAEPIVWEQA